MPPYPLPPLSYPLTFHLALTYPLTPHSPQDEMSHALATMRVQEGPALIKDIPASTNALMERRKNKKKAKEEPMTM